MAGREKGRGRGRGRKASSRGRKKAPSSTAVMSAATNEKPVAMTNQRMGAAGSAGPSPKKRKSSPVAATARGGGRGARGAPRGRGLLGAKRGRGKMRSSDATADGDSKMQVLPKSKKFGRTPAVTAEPSKPIESKTVSLTIIREPPQQDHTAGESSDASQSKSDSAFSVVEVDTPTAEPTPGAAKTVSIAQQRDKSVLLLGLDKSEGHMNKNAIGVSTNLETAFAKERQQSLAVLHQNALPLQPSAQSGTPSIDTIKANPPSCHVPHLAELSKPTSSPVCMTSDKTLSQIRERQTKQVMDSIEYTDNGNDTTGSRIKCVISGETANTAKEDRQPSRDVTEWLDLQDEKANPDSQQNRDAGQTHNRGSNTVSPVVSNPSEGGDTSASAPRHEERCSTLSSDKTLYEDRSSKSEQPISSGPAFGLGGVNTSSKTNKLPSPLSPWYLSRGYPNFMKQTAASSRMETFAGNSSMAITNKSQSASLDPYKDLAAANWRFWYGTVDPNNVLDPDDMEVDSNQEKSSAHALIAEPAERTALQSEDVSVDNGQDTVGNLKEKLREERMAMRTLDKVLLDALTKV